jgi:hypothetical protein
VSADTPAARPRQREHREDDERPDQQLLMARLAPVEDRFGPTRHGWRCGRSGPGRGGCRRGGRGRGGCSRGGRSGGHECGYSYGSGGWGRAGDLLGGQERKGGFRRSVADDVGLREGLPDTQVQGITTRSSFRDWRGCRVRIEIISHETGTRLGRALCVGSRVHARAPPPGWGNGARVAAVRWPAAGLLLRRRAR